MQNPTTRTVNVPSHLVEVAVARIEKINKRAAKLGVDGIEFSVGESFMMEGEYAPTMNADNFRYCPRTIVKDEYTPVTYTVKPVGFNGWVFVAMLDHDSIPGSTLVNAMPNTVVPRKYRSAAADCDHCGHNRARNKTYVLRNGDDYAQVGSTCIHDFLGHDPSRSVDDLTSINVFMDKINDDLDGAFAGSGGRFAFDHDQVLLYTIGMIREYGWLSRTKAAENFDSVATADRVMHALLPSCDSHDYIAQFVAKLAKTKEQDAKEIKAMRAWLEAQTATTEYMHNLKEINNGSAVPFRYIGFWASLVATYRREMDKLANKPEYVNEYVGTIKKRQNFTVTVERINTKYGFYGTTYIVGMVDDSGHKLVWFASRDPNMDKGKTYDIKGTVTKHQPYNGLAQTVINRVVQA